MSSRIVDHCLVRADGGTSASITEALDIEPSEVNWRTQYLARAQRLFQLRVPGERVRWFASQELRDAYDLRRQQPTLQEPTDTSAETEAYRGMVASAREPEPRWTEPDVKPYLRDPGGRPDAFAFRSVPSRRLGDERVFCYRR